MKIKISDKLILVMSIMYIYVPIVIFLCGFVKMMIAIPTSLIVGYCEYKIYKNYIRDYGIERNSLNINALVLICICLIVGIMMYFMGFGGYRFQNVDWVKHNGIMNDLINRDWPVYYYNNGEHSMLSYYIGQYIIPAFIGKICGKSYHIGEIATFVWAYIGVVIVYISLLKYLKIDKSYLQIGFLFLFFFLLGVQHFGKQLIWVYNKDFFKKNVGKYSFFWENEMEYSSGYVLIRWVFNQTIVSWIVTLMFLENKDKIEDYVTLALPLILFGVLPFVGLVPIFVGYAIYVFVKMSDKMVVVKKIFSIQNILMLISLGSVLFLYYYGNVFSYKPSHIGYSFIGINFKYMVFVLCMVVPYMILLYNDNKKNILYYIIFIELLILPMMKMGRFNDLTMRASIPALFIMMTLVMKSLNDYIENKKWQGKLPKKIWLILMMVCITDGSIAPIEEMVYTVNHKNMDMKLDTMEVYADRNSDYAKGSLDHMVYNYFSYDIEDNLFYKYIARVKDKKYKKVKSGRIDTKKEKQ